MKNIAVIVAMDKEFAQLSSLLTDKKDVSEGCFRYVMGKLEDKTIVLHKCGIGKVNAAVGATQLVNKFHPECIISSGCAGGIDSTLKVMDVVVSKTAIYHDAYTGFEGEGADIEQTFAADSYLVNKAEELAKVSSTHIHMGQICTGDQFITDKAKLETIKQARPEGLAVDMESAAIAQTCKILSVPFISFRIISDTIGAEFHFEEYKNFWEEMAEHSFSVIYHYIESL